MLKVVHGRQQWNCEGVSRRDFLQVGGLGFGGLTLANLLAARSSGGAAADRSNTSVVWLWLNGGPTHIETFDPKMSAPVEFRSVTGEVKTVLPGRHARRQLREARPAGGQAGVGAVVQRADQQPQSGRILGQHRPRP